ncbi:MAG TPA: DUF2092 domain-containing protein [Pirellulales bacterium]|jgi:outer membrane lipoprotein-sorting protein
MTQQAHGRSRTALRKHSNILHCVAWLGIGLTSAMWVGCGGGNTETSPGNSLASAADGKTGSTTSGGATAGSEHRTAQQILKDMETAYRKAKSYADEGQVHIRFERDGKTFEDNLPFSVAFVRPNKLRMLCYDAMVVSDGKQFHAALQKFAPNQVLEVAAPAVLSVGEVVRDRQLRDTLAEGPAGGPVQLPFLMDDNTLAQLLQDAMQPPKLLSQESIEGHVCNRIEIDESQGKLTLWIDQHDNLLRQINLPPEDLRKMLEQNGPVKNLSLTIELHQARFDQPIDETAFKFEVPEGAKVSDSLATDVPPATIAPQSDPSSLKLTKLWTAADLNNPGNVLVVDGAAGQPRIFVFDGWRSVAELDGEGKVLGRHELDIPADAVACFLRTTTDAQGRRYFVVSANGQPQCHVFDENWKRLLSFPKPEEGATEGIGDVQIADLNGSGKPQLCVSYWGDIGVQGVALDGNRLWRDRSLQFVLRTAVTDRDAAGHRQLLCTHSKGTIVPLDFEGKPEKEIVVPDRRVYYVAAADLAGKGQSNYCALAGSVVNDNTALGISLDGKELWNYPLPPGVHGRPIEVITSGDLTGETEKQWLIAGADGSIHMVSADGKPIDKFNTGAMLTGVGAAKIGEKHLLLVSSALAKPDGERKGNLEAWLVEPAAK